MVAKKALLSVFALILLVASAAIIYYLVKANFYATGAFWDGAITGVFGCILLVSLTLTFSLKSAIGISTKRLGLMLVILITSGLATAILLYFKPGDSDLWWYGAIAGFFSCLSLVLLGVTVALVFKLIHKT